MRKHRRLFAAAVLLGTGAVLAGVLPSGASSHREAPLISKDPVADSTDLYAFVSPEADKQDTVTIITNWIPFEEPAGGPNFNAFGDDVKYGIEIDNNGDGVEDIEYEFRFKTTYRNPNTFLYNTGPFTSFNDPNLNVRQTYSVARVDHGHRRVLMVDQPVVPPFIGPRSTPNYASLAGEGTRTIVPDGGTKVYAGPRDDPFFVDLGSIFDLGGLRPFSAAHILPPTSGKAVDAVAGYNVHTIAMQIPLARLTSDGKAPTGADDPRAVIGVWTTSYRQRTRVLSAKGTSRSSGNFVQVSRLGMPLVNEVVVPLGAKDLFSASEPKDDAQFLGGVTDPELAKLIPVLYAKAGITVPPAPRNDLVSIFLTGISGLNQPANVKPSEMLRLNMMIKPTANPSPLGLLGGDNQGFPNGRRLTDDITDIELRALAGGTPFTPAFNKAPNNALGDGVDANDVTFEPHFPYLAMPHDGYRSHGGA